MPIVRRGAARARHRPADRFIPKEGELFFPDFHPMPSCLDDYVALIKEGSFIPTQPKTGRKDPTRAFSSGGGATTPVFSIHRKHERNHLGARLDESLT